MSQPFVKKNNLEELPDDTANHPGKQREYFIPIRKTDLYELLPDYHELDSADQNQFQKFCRLLNALIHHQYHNRLDRLIQIYTHLDPDSAEVKTSEITDLLRDSLADQFFSELETLMERANYVRLKKEQVIAAVEAASQLGVTLRVDFDVFEHLEVYARGNSVETWTRRDWRKFYRKVDFDVAVYRRLIIVFRLKENTRPSSGMENENFVYLKTFKNIPHSDLDVLLPGTKVKMTLMDRSKLIVPTLSGIAINLFKAWRTLMLVTVFASIYNFLGLAALVIATFAYLVKFIFGLARTHDKYQLSVTQHLYFQNLDNNKGGIYRLMNEAESQDFRETAIAYFMLWQAGDTGLSSAKLDALCEKLIFEITDRDVDFEVDDALSKLESLQILSKNEEGNWIVDPPQVAVKKLDNIWDNVFP